MVSGVAPSSGHVDAPIIVVETTEFVDDLEALTTKHGFRIESIYPADAPTIAVVESNGVRLRLTSNQKNRPVTIYTNGGDTNGGDTHRGDTDQGPHRAGPIMLPGGTRIEPNPDVAAVERTRLEQLTEPGPVVVVPADGDSGVGRAGMRYRDLLPDRWGGRYIVSHITIPDGGPVPDYVHFHRIGFQLIFVKSGWVKVVYEDQGDPFVMNAGDCVLQPPEIRHRVLDASSGLEVIEIAGPALHETIADHSMSLPNGIGDPNRTWSGQRFVRHIAETARVHPWINPKWVYRDTGIGTATDGEVDAVVATPGEHDAPPGPPTFVHASEFASITVLGGEVTAILDVPTALVPIEPTRLTAGANIALPPGTPLTLRSPSSDCEILVVTVHTTTT